MKKLVIIWIFFVSLLQVSMANNIQITEKPRLVNKDKTAQTVQINFPLTWENSWKTNTLNNWDAAWVFAKYRGAGTDWFHVYIDTLNNAHSVKGNVNLNVKVGTSLISSNKNGTGVTENKGLGAFIYRADNGKGNIKIDSIKLKWKYADQNIGDDDILSIRVYAIEMVYVPQGSFQLGDGTTNNRAISLVGNSGDIILGTAAFNPPGTRNTVFNNMGTITYPTGAIGTAGNGSNGAPSGWYAERGSNGATLYRNVSWNTGYWSSAITPFSYKDPCGSSCGFHSGSNPIGGTHTFMIKMPKPYKATGVYFSYWYTSYRIQKYRVEASTDSINWVTLAGDLNTTHTLAELPELTNQYFPISPDKQKAYQYYKYDFYTGTHVIISSIGMYDETPNGHPENAYYYENMLYKGQMPLCWKASGQLSSPTYPNGYEAFYMMKYELSQHAYVDFLNTLTQAQQRARVASAGVDPASGTEGFYYASGSAAQPTNPRNYIVLKTKKPNSSAIYHCYQSSARNTQDYSEQGGNIAMSLMNWCDNAAYLCWSGLRPLTELEYEKACKGPKPPVPGMYAWGTATAIAHTGVGTYGIYTADEMVTPGNANFICQGTNGIFPARVGCLSTQSSNRSDAGAGYYGAMNLSDNVSEFYVNCETPAGLAFSGEHGTGILDGDGFAQIATWPNNTNASATHGTGFKGVIAADATITTGTVANRDNITGTASYIANRYSWVGCRGGRTAPK